MTVGRDRAAGCLEEQALVPEKVLVESAAAVCHAVGDLRTTRKSMS